MKKILCLFLLTSLIQPLLAQEEFESESESIYEDDDAYLIDSTYLRDTRSFVEYRLGQGVRFDLENGHYTFTLGGFIQPYVRHEFFPDQQDLSLFRVQRGRAEFRGQALREGLHLFLSADFVDQVSLMDAWVGWTNDLLFISFGQKQVFTNNREMINPDNNLNLPLRSMLSRAFSRSGREFGLFVEGAFGQAFQIKPKVSVTSGDGRNSFGRLSDDPDKGGLKFGGRLDILPFGAFTGDGELHVVDIYREPAPKLILGAAYSVNNGASDEVGEGHGNFITINEDREESLPDYHQFYVDLLFKWAGFSLLGEFGNGYVTTDEVLYDAEFPADGLTSANFSALMAMGTSLNVQASYFTPINLSIDLRYSSLNPEFEEESESLLQKTTAFTVGFSQYLAHNALKVQLSGTYMDYDAAAISENEDSRFVLNLLAQLTF